MKILGHYALHQKVLCVAVEGCDGWRVYCAPVPGRNHVKEREAVAQWGSKLEPSVACALFPALSPREYVP